MIKCETCPTSYRACNDCYVRVAKEVFKVLDEDTAKHFNYYMKRFDGAWKEMAKT